MLKIQGTADGLRSLRLSKKSRDFSESLPNVSIFGPLCGPKICRCAAQTPAGAGFLQTFDPIRGGLRPLELPFLKVISVKRGFLDTLKGPQIPCGLLKFRGFTRPALPPARPSDPRSRACAPHAVFRAGTPDFFGPAGNESRQVRGFAWGKTLVRRGGGCWASRKTDGSAYSPSFASSSAFRSS